MKTMELHELLGLSLRRCTRPVRAWMIARRIDMLTTEREISRAAELRERRRQKAIDSSQARLWSELMQLKLR